jgi:hypothetical protein
LANLLRLPRLHLGEIHEQPWCPSAIRDGATDCLNALAGVARQYDRAAPRLTAALAQSGSRRIVDLCSGGGGPWWRLAPQVAGLVDEVVLTDLFPSDRAAELAARSKLVRVWPGPVDATRVPPALEGFRTLFTAFHHFAPEAAQALLQDAVAQGQGIAIFEQTRRTLPALLLMVALPLLALLVVPFIRPWRTSRLVWTYLIPAIPLVLMVDGIISCLRTYTEAELTAMIEGLYAPDAPARAPYHWEVGHLSSPLSPIGVIYALGYPDAARAVADADVTGPRVARTK